METEKEIKVHLEKNDSINMEYIEFQKMLFLFNAVNNGWTVKKDKGAYIFKKNHEGKREVFEESFLHSFVRENFDINKLLR
jgi:hypothetical protein